MLKPQPASTRPHQLRQTTEEARLACCALLDVPDGFSAMRGHHVPSLMKTTSDYRIACTCAQNTTPACNIHASARTSPYTETRSSFSLFHSFVTGFFGNSVAVGASLSHGIASCAFSLTQVGQANAQVFAPPQLRHKLFQQLGCLLPSTLANQGSELFQRETPRTMFARESHIWPRHEPGPALP